MLQGELLGAEQQGAFGGRRVGDAVGDRLNLRFLADPARRDLDADPLGGGIEQPADRRPIGRERESGAERAALAVGLGERAERAALGDHRRFAARAARSARHRADGDGEPGQIKPLDGERVGGLVQPGPRGVIGDASRGEVDDAGMAAVEDAEEVDGVGQVPGAVRATDQRRAREIGMGGAAVLGNAGGKERAGPGAACFRDRN
jgi:hypothetical protein